MKCEFCSKEIYGMTGLQEIQKYQKHLRRCKKNQLLCIVRKGDVDTYSVERQINPADMVECLDSRVRSEEQEDKK